MKSQPVRLFLATGIFSESADEEWWHGTFVDDLAANAERALALAAGADYGLLSSSARDDPRRSLARFLSRLLLLRPDQKSIDQVIEQWIAAQVEMLMRLRLDWNAICQSTRKSSLPEKVVRIEGELSDRHNGGRSATILTFASGGKVVYKPRAMGLENWYSLLLEWLNKSGAPLPLRSAWVLPRDGYGWMEFVPHERCRSQEELRGYYRNAGALLCILHLLRASDCHFQNVIACGVNPMLIDAEILFQPSLIATETTRVTQTGLIPSFRFGPHGQTYDVSALGFVRPQTTHFEIPEWGENGVEFRGGRLVPEKNVPFAEDEEPRPENYVEEMVDGFSQTYRLAERHRKVLLARIHPTANLPVRYLVRETMDYYAAWGAEAGASICLPELQPAFATYSAIRSQELSALRQFDIPRFALAANSRELPGIGSCFACSGHDLVIGGIEALSDADLQSQIHHLRLCWSFFRLARSLA